MPTDVSALQLVLTADPALIAIVRLSLIVSLSAVLWPPSSAFPSALSSRSSASLGGRR